jgi:hypothetical protein
MIKKTLMEELPIRDAIQKLDDFLAQEEKPSETKFLTLKPRPLKQENAWLSTYFMKHFVSLDRIYNTNNSSQRSWQICL